MTKYQKSIVTINIILIILIGAIFTTYQYNVISERKRFDNLVQAQAKQTAEHKKLAEENRKISNNKRKLAEAKRKEINAAELAARKKRAANRIYGRSGKTSAQILEHAKQQLPIWEKALITAIENEKAYTGNEVWTKLNLKRKITYAENDIKRLKNTIKIHTAKQLYYNTK